MKLCWHSWKVCKVEDTYREAKISAATFAIPFIVFLNSFNFSTPLVCILSLFAMAFIGFFFAFSVSKERFKSGPKDKVCIKCNKVVLNATKYAEKAKLLDGREERATLIYNETMKARQWEEEVARSTVKVDKKTLMERF